ncbi:hypothetical protein GOV07_05680 [Candidatus Woesearchaeota archaeon]|nr:hypothetical protein [Candidatus Woesearchaeota archaeon]
MHPLDASILEAFRRDPSRAFSTSELVRDVFPKKYGQLNQQIHSQDRKTIRQGYATKAKLHRKLLYHVNKLVEQQLLKVSGLRGKGEKLFVLAMEEGEIVIKDKAHRIVISKPGAMATPVDGDVKEGLIRKFQPNSWLNKQNAIMLDARAYTSFEELQHRLQQVFPGVNDTIAIYSFERLLDDNINEAKRFLENLCLDAHDYNSAVSILISIRVLKHDELLLQLLKEVLPRMPRQVSFIFSVTPRLLTRKESFFRNLLQLFAEEKRKLNLKNSALVPAPIFFGRAGTYSFTSEDWNYYKSKVRGKAPGCVVGQLSMVVDIKQFFSEGGTITGFRELATRAANAFFEVEEQRRKHFAEYFGFLNLSNLDASKQFFKVGRSYLRFWNYEWDVEDESPIFDLLGSVKEEVDKFCTMQETIFKSCGLPIRFKVGLSTSFAKFDQELFSERRYQKTAISTTKELQTKKMKDYLQIREQLFRVFEGADRLRFFIARGVSTDETMSISRYLLSAYDLPCFTLDFRGKAGELKLTTFMEDS